VERTLLVRLPRANRGANDECIANTKFPSSPEGKHQEENDCLQQDVEGGYKCLDQVGKDLAEMNAFQALPSFQNI
jgi:hypothetical protein